MKLLNNLYIKLTSWILIVSFILVYILSDYAYARDYTAMIRNLEAARQIEVPFEYGQVVEQYKSDKFPRVILIQDLHANYEVQKNIKGILDFVDQNRRLEALQKQARIFGR